MSASAEATFPRKERWTPEESLAVIKSIDGTETVGGIPLPGYVQTRDDKVRWVNSVRVATRATGAPIDSVFTQQTARIIFSDRQAYGD